MLGMFLLLLLLLLSFNCSDRTTIDFSSLTFFVYSLLLFFLCLIVEITKLQASGRMPARNSKFVDLYEEQKLQVVVNVLVPVKEHPTVR